MTERIVIISLGCSKNLVDSEKLAAQLSSRGYDVSFDSEDYDGSTVVVNTCGFIGDAKEESINTVLNALELKSEGKVKKVYLMGCLGERYRNELMEEMPELDGLYGKYDWNGLLEDLKPIKVSDHKAAERNLSTPPHFTYIKVSEGCDRFCAFCAIPLITGRHHSRSIEDIEQEVRALAADGTREFNIVAQDLSSYGKDIYGEHRLAQLIDRLAVIPGVDSLRLHYAYPADFPMDILPVMARHSNVCRYLDIALQHIDDTVLKNMRRHIDSTATRALLKEIRRQVPGIHIRTTMMVGFPGEDEEAFERLLDFVKEQRFERLGAFAYCEEEDTYAAKHFEDSIPEEVKQERLGRLMALQQEIAFEIAEQKKGELMPVIIDEETDEYYVGRTEFDSPEVDCSVLVEKSIPLRPGDIIDVRINSSCGFDLIGTPEGKAR